MHLLIYIHCSLHTNMRFGAISLQTSNVVALVLSLTVHCASMAKLTKLLIIIRSLIINYWIINYWPNCTEGV